MKFIDKAKIFLQGGKGGDGCCSFRREKFIPKGGPDGGDGGRGGHVIIEAEENIHTLADFSYNRHYKAEHGGNGRGKTMHGKMGEDLSVIVPCGTVVIDAETNEILADLSCKGDKVLAAFGGRGGKGNARFTNDSRQAPRICEKGDPGQERWIKLELKLLADIGIVGLPNAGKSSLLKVMSNANPKIGDYPFTTLTPQLGVLKLDLRHLVVADIPGLVEGASDGKGLGTDFLRHIQRTRYLIHMMDISRDSWSEIEGDYQTIFDELDKFDHSLVERGRVLVCNKIDIPCARDRIDACRAFAERMGLPVAFISALTGEGVNGLVKILSDKVKALPNEKREPVYIIPERGSDDTLLMVTAEPDGAFRIVHSGLEKMVRRMSTDEDDSVARMQRVFAKMKVEKQLQRAGALDGDTIRIGEEEFIYTTGISDYQEETDENEE